MTRRVPGASRSASLCLPGRRARAGRCRGTSSRTRSGGNRRPSTWVKALTVIASKLRGLVVEDGSTCPTLTAAFGCYRLDLPEGTWVDLFAVESGARDALAAGELDQARAAAESAESLVRRPFLPGEDGAWVEARRSASSPTSQGVLCVLAEACLRSATLETRRSGPRDWLLSRRSAERVSAAPLGRERAGERVLKRVGRGQHDWLLRRRGGRSRVGGRHASLRVRPCYQLSTGLASTARGHRSRGCRPGDRDVAHVAPDAVSEIWSPIGLFGSPVYSKTSTKSLYRPSITRQRRTTA